MNHAQDEVELRGALLQGPRRHARRSPRGRDDARGDANGPRGACSVARIRHGGGFEQDAALRGNARAAASADATVTAIRRENPPSTTTTTPGGRVRPRGRTRRLLTGGGKRKRLGPELLGHGAAGQPGGADRSAPRPVKASAGSPRGGRRACRPRPAPLQKRAGGRPCALG